MPQQVKSASETISRGEATILLGYVVDTMKKPTPKRGFYYFLHRQPADVAKEFGMSVLAVCNAMRRKLPDDEMAAMQKKAVNA